MTRYLKAADVLVLHALQIERYGGSAGLRDMGQLESALYRPQTGYYPDLIAETAALWESLSQNHPFIDGNKRAAMAASLTFMIINGLDADVNADEMWTFLSGLYETHGFRFEAIDTWLRQHAKPIAP